MASHQGAHTAKEAAENDVLVSGLAWSDTMSRFCCKPSIGGAEACAVEGLAHRIVTRNMSITCYRHRTANVAQHRTNQITIQADGKLSKLDAYRHITSALQTRPCAGHRPQAMRCT